ncbi:MAG TPA: CinA family nicotinamide mononucleotide deamidase-related protein [Pseudomonadales bacterium]|nr:CinA family nicotinamide mononucleotide deamidase-related protein [Pseudomonadales bacterium]
MQIQLLMTGSELMRGTTVDSNSVRIADALATLGLAIHRKVTVGDDRQLLVQELRAIANDADVLIVNGGLGPTSDDLTAEALASAAGDTLAENPAALSHLAQWCSERKIALNAANRKQAMLPASSFLLDNPVGSAVGFGLRLGSCLVLCTPGVPRELEAMLAHSILPLLQQQFPDCERQLILRMHLFGIGESQAQEIIDKNITGWPDGVVPGFRAGMPTVEIKLLARASMAAIANEYFIKLQTLFADYVVALGEDTMASALLELLASKNKTLVCAESCTGGLISAMLTEIPGASRAFLGSFVTYSNNMKTSLLGVSDKTLQGHGAVSEETARAMAEGAINQSRSDYVLAVTGIAGPDGGTEEKPVGTVWIAWGDKNDIKARRFNISGPRKRFQQLVAALALDLLRRQAGSISTEPAYFSRW